MAVLDVIKYGHPDLRKKATPVNPEAIDQEFIQDLLETMKVRDGVGLAATQVDVMQRIVVIHDYENTYVLINPEIIAHSESMDTGKEGCLSLPGLQADVPRYEKVIVRALNENGEPVEITGRGLLAIILQHEIDHLDGVLYIDRADLDTLEWVDNEADSGLPADAPAALPEVEALYKSVFHSDRKELEYGTRETVG